MVYGAVEMFPTWPVRIVTKPSGRFTLIMGDFYVESIKSSLSQ